MGGEAGETYGLGSERPDGDTDAPLVLVALELGRMRKILEADDERVTSLQHDLGKDPRHDGGAAAFEERHPGGLLQPGQGAAEAGLARAELVGGAREVPVRAQGTHDLQIADSSHLCPNRITADSLIEWTAFRPESKGFTSRRRAAVSATVEDIPP